MFRIQTHNYCEKDLNYLIKPHQLFLQEIVKYQLNPVSRFEGSMFGEPQEIINRLETTNNKKNRFC